MAYGDVENPKKGGKKGGGGVSGKCRGTSGGGSFTVSRRVVPWQVRERARKKWEGHMKSSIILMCRHLSHDLTSWEEEILISN